MPGAFGENYPYTNFHDLNLDWIIQIVKDFKDKYSGIESEVSADVDYIRETTEHIEDLIESIPMFINNVLIPDNYPGTDTQKLQECLDELQDTGGVIVLNRSYTLDENLIVRQDTNNDHAIFLVGFGKRTELNMGTFSFTGTMNGRTGGLWFTDVSFNGTGTAFICDALIRMHFTNCYFRRFSECFTSGTIQGGNRIMQSLYVNMCHFRRIGTAFHNIHNGIFDVHITNSIFEVCTKFFHCEGEDFIALLSVTNCCIEGCGTVFIASPNQAIDQCIFNYDYFESNTTYFDLSNALFSANMSICDNFIGESADVSFVKLPASQQPSNGYITVERNTLADKTARTSVFNIPSTSGIGSYKGVRYDQNRFNHLTPNNADNNKLVPNPVTEFEFTGSNQKDFFKNAISYFAYSQMKRCESYKVMHTGQTNYMLIVCKLSTTTAFALAMNRQEFFQIYYDGTNVEVRKVTTTLQS